MTTSLLVIDANTIKALAPPEKLIGWMRDALVAVSRRDAVLPLRQGMAIPNGGGAIGIMPGFVGADVQSAGVKLVSLVPVERRKGSSHLGLMVLYDADGLLPVALLCGATITNIRTSAVTAVATDALARSDARSLAILGTGEQSEAHVEALRQVRPFDDIRIWGRNHGIAKTIAARHRIRAVEYVDEAIAGADVVCTVTSAREPILFGSRLTPGTHVNLVGSSAADCREADDDLVVKSRFFVDYRPSTLAQAGEFLGAMKAGLIRENHIAGEIGEVLDGAVPGRTSPEEITVYKSLGVAAEDIVTARHVFELATKAGLGSKVTL